jgi:hypothetical protein
MPPPKDGLLPRADLLPAPLADLPPAGLLPPRGVDGCFIMDAGWPSPRGVLPAGGIGRRAGAGRALYSCQSSSLSLVSSLVVTIGSFSEIFRGTAAQNDGLRAFWTLGNAEKTQIASS